jgi:DnaK suppressor protein
VDDIAEALEGKRVKLETELARISAPPGESSGISFGKRVGDGTSMAVDRLVDVAAHDNLRVLLADVERALTKFRDGTYGVCDRCGVDIAPERLEALPWAVRCVRCANRR